MALNQKQLEHLAEMAKDIGIGLFVTFGSEPIATVIAGSPLTLVLGSKLVMGAVLYFVMQGVALLIKGRLDE